jgi:hypothetical protein
VGDLALIVGIGLVATFLGVLFVRRRNPKAWLRSAPDLREQDSPAFAPVESSARPFLLFGRGSRKRQLVDLYLELIRRAAKLGYAKTDGQTASEYSEVVRQCVQPAPAGLDELTTLFEKARYSESPISTEELEQGKSAAKKAYRSLKDNKKI